MKRTFVFIYPYGTTGGAETYIRRVCQWLVSKDENVIVVTAGPCIELFEEKNIRIIRSKLFEKTGLFNGNLKNVTKEDVENEIASLIKELRCRTSSIFAIEIYFAWYMSLAMRIADEFSCRLILRLIHPNHFREPRVLDFLKRAMQANSIISMNKQCLNELEKIGGDCFAVANNIVPIPIEMPHKVAMPIISNECKLLSISRLDPDKEYVIGLIGMMPNLIKSNRKLKLTIVGDGIYGNLLRSLTRRSGLENYVDFVGMVSEAELEEYYTSNHIFIGMGTSSILAAAYGIPTIVASIGLVGAYTQGYFSELPDYCLGERLEDWPYFPMIKKIENIMRCQKYYKEIQKKDYERAQLFSIDRVMQQWLKSIEKACPFWHR